MPFSRDCLVKMIGEAIAVNEGFYALDGIIVRNNNPGALKIWGNERIVDGFVDFNSPKEGFKALHHQIEKNIFERELTLQEFFLGKEDVYPGYCAANLKYPQKVANFLEERGFPTISTIQTLKAYLELYGSPSIKSRLDATTNELEKKVLGFKQNEPISIVNYDTSVEKATTLKFGGKYYMLKEWTPACEKKGILQKIIY